MTSNDSYSWFSRNIRSSKVSLNFGMSLLKETEERTIDFLNIKQQVREI